MAEQKGLTPIEQVDVIILDLMKKCLDEGIRLGLKHERVDGHETLNVTDFRDQALSSICKIIRESVPKDKQGIKHKEYPMENGSHYSPIDNQKVGYNQAIAELRQKWQKG